MKLEENLTKTEDSYREIVLGAERERSDLEWQLTSAASQLEDIERQRLDNLQTAVGQFQRQMSRFGPACSEVLQKLAIL